MCTHAMYTHCIYMYIYTFIHIYTYTEILHICRSIKASTIRRVRLSPSQACLLFAFLFTLQLQSYVCLTRFSFESKSCCISSLSTRNLYLWVLFLFICRGPGTLQAMKCEYPICTNNHRHRWCSSSCSPESAPSRPQFKMPHHVNNTQEPAALNYCLGLGNVNTHCAHVMCPALCLVYYMYDRFENTKGPRR